MSSIRLHSKYGVNPTILACFWCGGEKNELALLGAGYSRQAPQHMVLNYEPCDTCKSGMDQGITFIEVSHTTFHHGQPSMVKDQEVYPSGRMFALREEAVKRFVHPPELLASILKHRKTFVLEGEFDALLAKLGLNAKCEVQPEVLPKDVN